MGLSPIGSLHIGLLLHKRLESSICCTFTICTFLLAGMKVELINHVWASPWTVQFKPFKSVERMSCSVGGLSRCRFIVVTFKSVSLKSMKSIAIMICTGIFKISLRKIFHSSNELPFYIRILGETRHGDYCQSCGCEVTYSTPSCLELMVEIHQINKFESYIWFIFTYCYRHWRRAMGTWAIGPVGMFKDVEMKASKLLHQLGTRVGAINQRVHRE